MTQEELDDATHKTVVEQFAFICTFTRALNGRRDQKELQKFIIQERISLKKKNKKNYINVNSIF